jgi:hypothetical protein
MSSYSVADASADVECILRDFQRDFVMDEWMNVSNFQNSILGTHSSPELPSVCRSVAGHYDSMKYLKFVSAALVNTNLFSNIETSSNIHTRQQRESATTTSTTLDTSKPLNQTEFLELLPFSVSVAKIVENNSTLRDIICSSEITPKQLQKDIERDQLVVDGQRMIGSNVGLDSCLRSVGDAIDNCLASCFLPSLSGSLRDEVVRAILTSVSRTNSGGVALHTLRSITGEAGGLTDHTTTRRTGVHDCLCYLVLFIFLLVFFVI